MYDLQLSAVAQAIRDWVRTFVAWVISISNAARLIVAPNMPEEARPR